MNAPDDNFIINCLRRPYLILSNALIIIFLISVAGCKNDSGITKIGPPPNVRSTIPANHATEISISAPITAHFNEQMNPTTISENSFQLRNDTALIAGTVTYSDSTATFQPSTNLAYSSSYTASVTDNVENLAGQTIAESHEWSFTTIAEPPGPDVTPPQIVDQTPEADAENVSVNTTVQIMFNEPINIETLTGNTFFVTSEESPVDGTISYNEQVANFKPEQPLNYGTTYTATLDETIEDTAGNAMDSDTRWSFTTEADPDNSAPSITSTEPANGQTDIAPNSAISVTFSEPMNPESLNSSSFILRQGSTGIAGTITYADQVATFTPSGTLAFANSYTATITTGASDLAGNPLGNNFSWGFTTGDEPDNTPPQIVETNPSDDQEDIDVDSPITVTFSEPMNASSINTTTFFLKADEDNLDGQISYSGLTAIFNPNGDLPYGTTITAEITSNVEDISGNPLAQNMQWSFTTEQESTPPSVVSTDPADGDQNVAPNTTITATFSEPINPSTVTNNSFRLFQNGTPIPGTINTGSQSITFNPDTNLEFRTSYAATISSVIEDLAGNTLRNDVSWSFTTGNKPDNTAPVITSITPTNNQQDVAVGTSISVTFSEAMDGSTINSSTFVLVRNGSPVSGNITLSGNTATLNPFVDLGYASTYSVTITETAADLAGNPLGEDVTWTFSTESETTPPTVVDTEPGDNATDVTINSNILATFSEPMNRSTINNQTFRVTQGGSPISGAISYSGVTAIFNPSSALPFGTTLTATLATGAEDMAGNPLPNDVSWTFTTEQESTPPVITSTSPSDDADEISIETTISATFNEAMNPASINSTTFRVFEDDDDQISGTVTLSGNTATFTPSESLSYDEDYTATISSDVEDAAGNNLADNFTWSFSTGEEPDNSAPQIINTSPTNNENNVTIDTDLTATFNELMDPESINESTFVVRQGNTEITGTVLYSGTTATFSPTSNLPFGSSLTATITDGAKDLAGNNLDRDISWSFTTENESTPPVITSTTPDDNAQDVPVSSTVTASFNEAMDPATIITDNFQVIQDGTTISGEVNYTTNRVTFTPTNNFEFNSTVTATITTDAQDLAGNGLDNNYSWSFTTEQESVPPTVVSTNPDNNATDVPVGSTISITFSEEMRASTINGSTFTVAEGGNSIAGSISLNGNGNTATFAPSDNLSFATILTATVTTGAEDLAGNTLGSTFSWNFTTAKESTPPSVVSTSPLDNAQDVRTNTAITANFSEQLDASTIGSSSFIITQNGTAIGGEIDYSGTTAIFTPNENLDFDTAYTATLTSAITDVAGNPLDSDFSWSFSTEQESTPPTVIANNPTENASDVAVDVVLSATFSEEMDPATIDQNTVLLSQNGTSVSGSVNYSGTTLTFNPINNLAFGSPFTATITTGVADLAGNNLQNNYSWSFTTVQESTPPTIVSRNPDDNATNVAVSDPITVTFSEPISAETITNSSFRLANSGSSVTRTVSYNGETNTATLSPSEDLEFGTNYTATLSTDIQDLAGNALENTETWSFTTEQESVPPEVSTVSPAPNAVDVPLNTILEATFSEALDPATVDDVTFTLTLNDILVSGSVNYDGSIATFTPASELLPDTTYSATLTTGIQDVVGNQLSEDYEWSFSTIISNEKEEDQETVTSNGSAPNN